MDRSHFLRDALPLKLASGEGSQDKAALKALLRAAITFNTSHKVPKSKGSRT